MGADGHREEKGLGGGEGGEKEEQEQGHLKRGGGVGAGKAA